jgi:glycosyltransferase 2 family protein
MRDRVLRFARWALALLIMAFVVRTFQRNWHDLRAQPVAWTFAPLPAVGSVLLVWGMYLLLIEAWRRMLAGWGQALKPALAARIWVLSSLGKYVPGKVWAIAGMALMAREAGVAPWAATASAILLQALAVGTGAATAALAGGRAIEAYRPGMLPWLWMGGAAAVAGVVALLHPRVCRRLLTLTGMGPDVPTPGAGPILVGLVSNLLAWVGYGLAFWLLAAAVLPASALQPATAIAAFAASYVVGLITLIAPGGLVVREGLLIAMLSGPLGLGPATALAIASRVLLTITELGAAVPFLLLRRSHPRAV